MLALFGFFAFQQRHQNAERAKQPRGEVGDRNAHAHGPLPGQAGDRHQAAHALRDLVEARPLGIRAGLPEPGNAGVDQLRIDLAQLRIVDAETTLNIGPEILDHHVGFFHHALEGRHRFRRLQVERHAALVAVRILEVRPSRGPPSGSPPPGSGGNSILITLAPQSASWRTQVGPERTRVRSRTVKRSSAREALGNGISGTCEVICWPGGTPGRPDIPGFPSVVHRGTGLSAERYRYGDRTGGRPKDRWTQDAA